MYTDVPDGTRLLGLSIKNGVATVDLSAEFESGGGKASILGRLAQVVYTLTQFSSVDAVNFELDGQPVTVFGGAGVVLDHPVGREDYTDQLPAIFMDRPAWGAALGHPGRVSGLANVFEATFRVRLSDAKGAVLVDRQVMATCGTGCWGTFRVDLAYAVPKAQYGTLRVYDRSAKDGSPENITEYPVWLTPGQLTMAGPSRSRAPEQTPDDRLDPLVDPSPVLDGRWMQPVGRDERADPPPASREIARIPSTKGIVRSAHSPARRR